MEQTYPRLQIRPKHAIHNRFVVEKPCTCERTVFEGGYVECVKWMETHDERLIKQNAEIARQRTDRG